MIPKFDTDCEQIKYWHDNDFMSTKKVWNLVGKKITEEDYCTITGINYPYMSEEEQQQAELQQEELQQEELQQEELQE